jgi:hypothetical protein
MTTGQKKNRKKSDSCRFPSFPFDSLIEGQVGPLENFPFSKEHNMKKMNNLGRLALALAFGLAAIPGQAEDAKIPASPEEFAKAAEAASQPGAAHERLKPLAGQWTYTCRMWMEPGGEPIETKGTIEREWILGGRFLSEKIQGTGFDGKPGFEGVGLIGYDNNLKKYTQTFACNMGTGTSTGVGTLGKSGGLTFQTECACPLSDEKIKGRDEIRFVSQNKIVTESYKTVGSEEVKMMEIIAVRK